jgi:hypothetical protein
MSQWRLKMLSKTMPLPDIGRYDRGIGGASDVSKYLISFVIAKCYLPNEFD